MRASEAREQDANKCNRASYWRNETSAEHKIDEIDPLMGTKNAFSKKVLRQRSGVTLGIISTHTSRATAVGRRLFKLLMKNLVREPLLR